MTLSEIIARQLNLREKQVAGTIQLLDAGATIPFISRYRKEATGGLNEVEVAQVKTAYDRLQELVHRRDYILQTIEEQGKLTDDLRQRIETCWDAKLLEELYLPFVDAVANNKKVKGAEKARYQAQFRQLQNSMVGKNAPDFEFTRPDGTHGRLSDVKANNVVLFFYDPDCFDCRLAKTRLAADIAVPTYINAGVLSIVAIYPGDPSDPEFIENAKELPENWVVGAYPDADRLFTMRTQPQFYYLDNTDGQRVVKVKDMPVDNIINTFNMILNNALQKASTTTPAPAAEAPATETPAEAPTAN